MDIVIIAGASASTSSSPTLLSGLARTFTWRSRRSPRWRTHRLLATEQETDASRSASRASARVGWRCWKPTPSVSAR